MKKSKVNKKNESTRAKKSRKPPCGMVAAMKHLEGLKILSEKRPGDEYYTTVELADLMNVSATTARTKMNLLIKEGLAEKIQTGSKTWYKTL